MLKLIQLAQSAIDADEKCILCSVMRLEGSGYGRVGARLLLTESGDREGYVSGGCLERDLRHRAWAEAAHAPRLIAFDTRGNSISPARYNTGCQGVVYVLCQPIDRHKSFFIDVAARVIDQRQSARMLTVYHSQSSSVQTGEAMVMFADGSAVESSSKPSDAGYLRRLLVSATEPMTASLLDRTGARIELTIEFLDPPPRLVVFGSGDDVVPVVRVALGLGWDVCVVGRSAESMTKDRFPGARLHIGEVASVPSTWFADRNTHVLLMTHDMASDVAILPKLLTATVGSVGLLGSKPRLARIVTELHSRGVPIGPSQHERFRCPVGLNIGAIAPEEIALSIVAELVALVRGGTGARLTEHKGSIHERWPHYNWELSQLELAPWPASSLDSNWSDSGQMQSMVSGNDLASK